MAGLLDSIKNDVKKSGSSKKNFIYFREGQKQRIRFLQDLEDGMEVVFHDSYERSINVPCQEQFGRSCPYCEDEGVRTRSQYCWSIYNYETKEVQLFMFPVNNCSPIPALVAMYENYGTLTDRDYVISVSGKQQNKTYSVVPMDKVKFRNDKAKPFSEKAVLKMLDKAWPCDATDDDDEEERPKKPAKAAPKKTKSAPEPEEDDYDDEQEWDDADEAVDYESMSAKELYKLCKERGLEAAPKKPTQYYVTLLQDDDKAHADWGDGDDDEDEWDEE